ncbi:MAG: hypothetical protein CMD29_03070 [Flavobacteriales bacterium]|nr:hypothetical protein [Flavobacteriales bacterium]|tara:strand:+ start:651 stop:881 length:231 start_codon:yes stop_codon:yes gene_type:complete
MSFNVIVEKLLESIKNELKKDEVLLKLRNDVIKPIVEQVLNIIYPYLLCLSILFITVILVIFIILFLNIKICYSNN